MLIRERVPSADPRIFQLFDAWLAARDGQAVTRRSAFDPLPIGPLLSFMWIYRKCPEQDDYVCELAGEDVNDAWRGSIKGHTLRQIVGDEHQPILAARWATVLGEPAILYSSMERFPAPHLIYRVERLVLPMISDTGEIDSVLGISLYDQRRERASVGHGASGTVPDTVVKIPVADL